MAAGGEIPDQVDYEFNNTMQTASTAGDRTVEAWMFWRATGQFPWPSAYTQATAADVDELCALERSYQDWKRIRNASA